MPAVNAVTLFTKTMLLQSFIIASVCFSLVKIYIQIKYELLPAQTAIIFINTILQSRFIMYFTLETIVELVEVYTQKYG